MSSYPKSTFEPLLVEPIDGLEDLEELEHALPVRETRVLLEVGLDQLADRLGLLGVCHKLQRKGRIFSKKRKYIKNNYDV